MASAVPPKLFPGLCAARPSPQNHDVRGPAPFPGIPPRKHHILIHMTRSNTPSMTRWASLRHSLARTARWSAFALTLAAVSQSHAEPPELKTQGNQIVVKATGERVRLVGVNFTGLEQDAGYDRNFLNSLDVLSG